MENNIKVRVTNRQTIDGDTDIIEERGEGKLVCRGNKHYIIYDVKSEGEKSRVAITAEGRKIKIKRTGFNSSDMVYDVSKKTLFKYRTPYGVLDMEIKTEFVCNALNSEPKKLKLKYIMTTQGQRTYNDTEISVENIR